MSDDIRPKGTVTVVCSGQGEPCREGGWSFWVDPLDPRLPDGPFLCASCTRHAQRAAGEPATVEEARRRASERFNATAAVWTVGDEKFVSADFRFSHNRKTCWAGTLTASATTWLDALDALDRVNWQKFVETTNVDAKMAAS